MTKVFNTGTTKTMISCFVCDLKLTGEKVNLASSTSSHSKVTLPEKISQLIGDDYVVAVTEQDCVCKRCASLLNHMDKLENELTLVKRALTSNISQKYKITLSDGQPPAQTLANGLKTDSASDYEDERKISSAADTTNAALAKKKPLPVNKMVATPKPAKPAENVTKLKIYKCGFCSYQSKELSNVRLHMKIHIKANKTEGEGDKTVSTVATNSPMFTPKTPVSVRRRVFRCQVCSASFDDRNKCLEHISRDHTAAGRKLVEQKQSQDEQQTSKQGETLAIPESSDQLQQSEVSQGMQQDENVHHEEMDTSSKGDVAGIEDGDAAKQAEYSQIATQSDNQAGNDDETPKDPNIGLDIEAMIAALHSEGPESGGESMPNI